MFNVALTDDQVLAIAESLGMDVDINMMEDFDSLSMTQKNAIIMKLVKSCIWDGDKLTITF